MLEITRVNCSFSDYVNSEKLKPVVSCYGAVFSDVAGIFFSYFSIKKHMLWVLIRIFYGGLDEIIPELSTNIPP